MFRAAKCHHVLDAKAAHTNNILIIIILFLHLLHTYILSSLSSLDASMRRRGIELVQCKICSLFVLVSLLSHSRCKGRQTQLGARTSMLSPLPSIKCVCLDHGRRFENRREFFFILAKIFWQRDFFTFFPQAVQAYPSLPHLSDPT